jgi:hypothetical protein
MRIAATILIVGLMTATLSGACGMLGLSADWCAVLAVVGWSLGLLLVVALWAASTARLPAQNAEP